MKRQQPFTHSIQGSTPRVVSNICRKKKKTWCSIHFVVKKFTGHICPVSDDINLPDKLKNLPVNDRWPALTDTIHEVGLLVICLFGGTASVESLDVYFSQYTFSFWSKLDSCWLIILTNVKLLFTDCIDRCNVEGLPDCKLRCFFNFFFFRKIYTSKNWTCPTTILKVLERHLLPICFLTTAILVNW